MSKFNFHPDNTTPSGKNWVFVFGSNKAGRHGKGAAKVAHVNFGAQYGVGEGLTGRAYAIPTKDRKLAVLDLDTIAEGVERFIAHAQDNPKVDFFVTRIGCVLAGYADADIAALFRNAPSNCSMPEPWRVHFDEI